MRNYIERKRVVLTLPLPAYEQLQRLAKETDRTIPGYVRFLITQHLAKSGLSVYVQENGSQQK